MYAYTFVCTHPHTQPRLCLKRWPFIRQNFPAQFFPGVFPRCRRTIDKGGDELLCEKLFKIDFENVVLSLADKAPPGDL